MPNIRSAKKRVKVICVKTERNKAYKSALRTAIKNAINDKTGAESEAVKLAIKKIDQAVLKKILHKNNAARKKAAIIKKSRAN